MLYKPFKQQKEFLRSKARIRCLFAAKRAGKSEVCYLDTIIKAEKQPGYIPSDIDPFLIGIIAPTEHMLRKLVWPKLRTFAKPFEKNFNKVDHRFEWLGNNTQILGFSGEKISRMEGFKLHHIHMTEAFQMSQEVFLEALARVSDTKGTITIDGSLGPNIPNPKNHWLYQTFIERKFEDSQIFTWATADNPHFPKDELDRMKDNLDPRTYRQMFTIDWNVPGTALVYDELDEANIVRSFSFNPNFETFCVVDWGWAHNMACLFFQYDPHHDVVYLYDEIVGSRIKLEDLWERIKAKRYPIKEYYCDIAGNQEREQMGLSNVAWFKQPPRNIHFKYRRTAVNYGIPIVRSYIKNGHGQRRFFIDELRCPKSLDSIRNYSYPEKDGIIQNENPVKKDDDPCDAIRYFFVNRLDPNKAKNTFVEFSRWSI